MSWANQVALLKTGNWATDKVLSRNCGLPSCARSWSPRWPEFCLKWQAARNMEMKKKSLEPGSEVEKALQDQDVSEVPSPKVSFFHAKLTTWKLNCIINMWYVSRHLWLHIFSIYFIYFKLIVAFRMLDGKIEFKYFRFLSEGGEIVAQGVLVWETSN